MAVTLAEVEQTDAPTPAVPVKRLAFRGFIVCLQDGKKLKVLKRHLKTSYDLSPAGYRSRWGLPPGYPMVAPNYAATRSGLANKLGFGRKPSAESGRRETIEAADPKPDITMIPARRAHGWSG